MNRLLAIIATLIIVSVAVSAQPPRPQGGHGPRPEKRLSPDEIARKKTDDMDKVLSLDEKQYKKIYRIYLKEENARQQAFESMGPMGPPPGGMPPMGGGFPGSGGFSGGFPGGFSGAGGPPPGMMGGGMPPMGDWEPAKPQVGGKDIDSDEYIDAREKKFQKILTEEQYRKWRTCCNQ